MSDEASHTTLGTASDAVPNALQSALTVTDSASSDALQSNVNALQSLSSQQPLSTTTNDGSDDRIAILQQIYQQKQAELLVQFQQAQASLAMQHLGYFHAYQFAQQQRLSSAPASSDSSPLSYTEPSITLGRPSEIHDDCDVYASAPPQSSSASAKDQEPKNRRCFTGSVQTISQLTRDRLKNMIATKKSRARNNSGGSANSQQAPGTPPSWTPLTPTTSTCSSPWSGQSAVLTHQQPINSPLSAPVTVSSPHFEPYPTPSNYFGHSAVPSDFRLRKTSSEPNLKMRIRAKLLSKGSSPVQVQQNNVFAYSHTPLRRSESDVPMDTGAQSGTSLLEQQPPPTLFTPPQLMMPSPSLPNLTSASQLQIDMSTLLAQAAFSPFLSMPSLLKNSLSASGNSLPDSSVDPVGLTVEGGVRQPIKFDTRTLGCQLPIGGYPSLLKQQLRDLVLRRKSLVREEPEDEASIESQLLARFSGVPGASMGPNQRRTGLVYDSAMAKHQCVCGDNKNHVEHGGRVQSIWARLQEKGILEKCERIAARKAPIDMLKSVHSSTFVTFFAISPTACLKMEPSQLPVKSFVQLPCGGIGVDSDTYFNDASTQLAARIAVGSLVELVTQVAEGRLSNGFACIRPPGHHAENSLAMGFCFFNNVAIAVKYLHQRFSERFPRIAIIDWDVHHGNGIQVCFESDPSVLYLSLHRHDNGNFFPGTGAVTEVGVGPGKGYTVNIPFSGDMMGDADYLAAWRVVVTPILDQFLPSFIVVAAGFDGARGHSPALGGYDLSPQLFGYFTRQLLNYADGRVVLALEGGYDLAAISDSAEECVRVLYDDDVTSAGVLSDDALNTVPKQSAQEAIQKVVAIHKKHWPSLTSVQGIGVSESHWQTISQRFATLTVEST